MVLIFGGSFDPIHAGHLDLSLRAVNRYQPRKLYLIPTKKNPLKDFTPGADASSRLQMAQIAVQELQRPEISVVDWEIQREGASYTWDTVQVVKHLHNDPEIVLVLGNEVLLSFAGWYRHQELLQSVNIVVCSRQPIHSKTPLERVLLQCGVSDGHWEKATWAGESRFVHTHSRRWIETMTFDSLPFSGTEIREILTTYRGTVRPPGLPNCVWDYIKKSHLYSVK